MSLHPGTRVGPYEILEAIGAGGMGEVYKARDTRLDRIVAIKILPDHLASDPNALARFEREGKALAALSHANILAVHDVGRVGATSFIVEEFLDGETLRERLSHGPLPWKEAVAIAASIADGVAAAHDRGIIHRDLKPDNVFLTSDGVVKVLDFGLATPPISAVTTDTTLGSPTSAGVMLGTAGYMAPEQIRGRAVTPATDVFAIGCVLHEMVAGRRPFDGATQGELFAAILSQPPRPLPDQVPSEIAHLIARCLEKDPAKRRQSARDLAFDLRSHHAWSPDTASRRGIRRNWLRFAAAMALLSALAGAAWFAQFRAGPAADSVAVLPFVNTTGQQDSEYLADGLTDQLINGLSQIGSLQVLARSTVAQFARPAIDPRETGRRLGVGAMISGRVSVRDDQVRIAVALVDVSSGRQLWGETYERQIADVADVPPAVSSAIAERLRLRTTDSEMARVTKRPTQSGPAYQAYLKGRFEINKRTIDALRRASSFFEEAVSNDVSFAPAHAGIAEALLLLVYFGDAGAVETLAAVAAAERALAIDPGLGEAHAALAVANFFRFRWSDAERAFKRAIELSPQFATAHHWYSHYLVAMGRWQESEAASRRALDLEPVNANIAAHLAWHYVYAREWDRAIEQCARTVDLDPAYYQSYFFRGQAHAGAGRFLQAIADLEKALALPGERALVLGTLGYTYGRAGQRQRAEATLDELMLLARPRLGKELRAAAVHAGLGRNGEAISAVEAAVKARNPQAVNINVEPMFDALRTDPRFVALVREIGLEPSK